MDGLASSTQIAELTILAREHDLLATGALTGLVLRDATGAVISANPAAVAILGSSLAEMQGSRLPSRSMGADRR